MTEKEVKLIVGGLLHDIGKVVYRAGDGRKHSKSGSDFLKEELKIDDSEILESVLYHHAESLKNADVSESSFAYITYIADNIASATDRREKETEDYGFQMSMPLQPVFNILNGNSTDKNYKPMMLDGAEINYPTDEKKGFDEAFYKKVVQMLKEALNGIEWTNHYVNSVLNVLETTLSYVPSSTNRKEVADISLYDHVKMTAAMNSCIYQYLEEQSIKNYKEELFKNAEIFYDKKAFLMYSVDISGIQQFIYTIHSKDALKMLRSRSFYLEIMMENIIDTLLEKLNLSRANLIYSGGGHCYMLLPNTENVKKTLDEYSDEVNKWLTENYDISLFVASGYEEASANTLKNVPEKSYSELFKSVSNKISAKKAHRYSADTITWLNKKTIKDYSRECRVCKQLTDVNKDKLCVICESLKTASKAILDEQFFVVTKEKEENSLCLPGGVYLLAESESKLKDRMIHKKESFIRAYSKNKFYTGLNVAAKIWVGNYNNGQTFEELADKAKKSGAIKRIGVLRADVDNMGQAFVSGFSEKYSTLSRTATLSRQLSLFFKYFINDILSNGEFTFGNGAKQRNATIVYSGGDDLFIVGAWNEIIEFALDLQNTFLKYTENTLSMSAGIGIYSPSYPISRIASEVGNMESESKRMDEKASVTILEDGEKHEEKTGTDKNTISDGTYHWNVFRDKVVMEKYSLLYDFFEKPEDRGKAFLYHILELIRGRKEKINFARYVYLLARLEPKKDASDDEKSLYSDFSKKMHKWMSSDEDCRQLKTAINLYAYMVREKEQSGNMSSPILK